MIQSEFAKSGPENLTLQGIVDCGADHYGYFTWLSRRGWCDGRRAEGQGARPVAPSLQIMRPNFRRGDRTPLQGLHKKPRWLAFGESLAEGETVEASAQRCGIAHSTAFQWRHRFLNASRQDPETLRGIVEADETYLL